MITVNLPESWFSGKNAGFYAGLTGYAASKSLGAVFICLLLAFIHRIINKIRKNPI